MANLDHERNIAKMRLGELYYAFTPQLTALRMRCHHACRRFNIAGEVPRRRLVELWRDVVNDESPLTPKATTEDEDELLFADDPWIDSPIKVDYGTNLRIGKGVYINCNCTFLDTCLITIGSRTLIGPNCSFYSATHPLDPFLRNGINGPELGRPITIGDDCWFGGNVIVLPGITIGRGVTVGAGSVVTKDVLPFHCVAGNPARITRKIEVNASDPLIDQQPDSEALKAVEAGASEETELS